MSPETARVGVGGQGCGHLLQTTSSRVVKRGSNPGFGVSLLVPARRLPSRAVSTAVPLGIPWSSRFLLDMETLRPRGQVQPTCEFVQLWIREVLNELPLTFILSLGREKPEQACQDALGRQCGSCGDRES